MEYGIKGHALIIPQSRWNPCESTYQPPPQLSDSGGHKKVFDKTVGQGQGGSHINKCQV